MIVLVGESCSGKTSLQDYMCSKYGFKRIVTYTTRPKRDNETNGVDYNFISEEAFEKMKNSGAFAETAEYRGWMYGSTKLSYRDSNAIVVLTPSGLRQIIKNGVKNVTSIYLNVPRRSRLIASLKRGDNVDEAYRRNLSDLGQFDGVEDEVDFVINNFNHEKPMCELATEVLAICDKVKKKKSEEKIAEKVHKEEKKEECKDEPKVKAKVYTSGNLTHDDIVDICKTLTNDSFFNTFLKFSNDWR